MTQYEMIHEYMKKHGSITPKDAYREFDCMRLAAQIFILKDQGVPIKTTLEVSKNSRGKVSRYARYSLCE